MSGRAVVALALIVTLLATPLARPLALGVGPAHAGTTLETDGWRDVVKSVNRALSAVLMLLKVLDELKIDPPGTSPPPANFGTHPGPLPVIAPEPEVTVETDFMGSP